MRRAVDWSGGPASRAVHNLIWSDFDGALCARAWMLRDRYGFWKWWVRLFGEAHCRASYEFHKGRFG